MGNWKTCILADLGEIVGGATPSTKNECYYGGDIPWITPKDLSTFKGRFISRGERNITIDGLNNCSTRLIPSHSVLFTSRAPIGYVAIAENELCTNQGFKSIVPNKSTDFLFLYYLLVHNREKIENMGSGTTFKEVSSSVMRRITVTVPTNIEEQQAIARILGALDNKIENNNAVNHHLEQMAQAIYAQAFPCRDNPTIPISELIDVRDGTHDSPKVVEKGFPLVTSKHLLPFGVDLVTPNLISKADFDKINERSKVDRHDILISMIGTIGLISLVIEHEINFAIKNVGLFKTSQTEDWVYFMLCFLRSPETKNHIDMRLAGSTQKYISLGELRQLPIFVPTVDELMDFNNTVRPLFEKIALHTKETLYLITLRDTLLPRLMSGELSIPDLGGVK